MERLSEMRPPTRTALHCTALHCTADVHWGLDHVEFLEGVELPHDHGGGDGELEVAGLGVGRRSP